MTQSSIHGLGTQHLPASPVSPPYTLYRIPDLSPSQLMQGWAMVPLPSLYVPPPGSFIALTPQPLQIRWELVPKGKEIQ